MSLVARAETGFSPLSGQLTDACGSIAANGGFGSPSFGQLTIGRHNSVQLDALAQYDPQALSYAFSFLGYSGFNGGAGSTEAARWDNSIRYSLNSGPLRVVGLYSSGGQDTGVIGKAYGIDAGVTYQGLSVDATYQNVTGAVNLRSSFDDGLNPLAPQSTATNPTPTAGLAAYISDDTSYNLMAKYTFDVGDPSQKDKLTVFAGYSHIEKAHADYTNGTAQDGYLLNVGINIDNSAEYQMEWIGAKCAMGSGWNFTGAFYHASQNSWTIGLGHHRHAGHRLQRRGLVVLG